MQRYLGQFAQCCKQLHVYQTLKMVSEWSLPFNWMKQQTSNDSASVCKSYKTGKFNIQITGYYV